LIVADSLFKIQSFNSFKRSSLYPQLLAIFETAGLLFGFTRPLGKIEIDPSAQSGY